MSADTKSTNMYIIACNYNICNVPDCSFIFPCYFSGIIYSIVQSLCDSFWLLCLLAILCINTAHVWGHCKGGGGEGERAMWERWDCTLLRTIASTVVKSSYQMTILFFN